MAAQLDGRNILSAQQSTSIYTRPHRSAPPGSRKGHQLLQLCIPTIKEIANNIKYLQTNKAKQHNLSAEIYKHAADTIALLLEQISGTVW